ncbi:MAG TPA: alpha/beta hydrolase [Candidatus Eisenbacteria bacterium]|nr:alpha/beta hydrolase [Candidatus Eisenbacteria bacterium]
MTGFRRSHSAAMAAAIALALCASSATARPAQPSGPGHTFKQGGATIWYEVRGKEGGRPLVMVNGGPGFDHTYVLCSDAWDTLAKKRRVVIYDQRGNGRSGALAAGQSCTLADQIADLDALRAELKADRIDLLGHSWGGFLVMAYATRHPDRVAHLMIVDSAAPKWTDTEFIFKNIYPEAIDKQARLDFAQMVGDSAAGDESLNEYLKMLFVSDAKRDEFMSRASTYKFSRSVNETLNADLGKYDMWPLLPTLTMPTIVMTGRYDFNVAPSTAWKIHNLIPNSKWEVFEKSGHLPYYEEPEKFVQVVERFCGSPLGTERSSR